MSRDQPEDLSADVLLRLSKHLDKLSGQVCDAEEHIGDLLSGMVPQRAFTFERIQSLDFVRQSLEDCALLLLYLGQLEARPEDGTNVLTDLRRRVKLDTTRNIILPAAGNDAVPRNDGSGSLEVF